MTPFYETSDIAVASFVLSQKATLLACVRVSPRRFVFRFEPNERLHELLRLYWNRTPIVFVPADLIIALRHLKSLIRAQELQTAVSSAVPSDLPKSPAIDSVPYPRR